MTWYSKYVQQHVSRASHLQARTKQAFAAYMDPEANRHGWLVGTTLLLAIVPVTLFVVLSQAAPASQYLEESLDSPDITSGQTTDLNVEDTMSNYGQSSGMSHELQAGGPSAGQNGGSDVSVQATINGQEASVTVNGDTESADLENGNYQKEVTSADGKTNIDISIKNSGPSNGSSNIDISSSSNIDISSSQENSDTGSRHHRFR